MTQPLHLKFDGGTVLVTGGTPDQRRDLPGVVFDSRTQTDRAEGRFYRAIVETIRERKLPYQDEARCSPSPKRGGRRWYSPPPSTC
jgi:hypothetical protein